MNFWQILWEKFGLFCKNSRACNFFAIWLRMLISFLNEVDIQLILEFKNIKSLPKILEGIFWTPCMYARIPSQNRFAKDIKRILHGWKKYTFFSQVYLANITVKFNPKKFFLANFTFWWTEKLFNCMGMTFLCYLNDMFWFIRYKAGLRYW